jgi:transcriptional regulator with XRE-family HTH domain
MGPSVTVLQGPIVTGALRTFGSMMESPERAAFALRMHELCDDLGVAAGHGRQAALGRMLNVTPKGARKWLTGEGWPEMSMAVRIANLAGVNLLWLLQGSGPKRGERIDPNVLALVEAIEHLPKEERGHIANYLRFEFQKLPNWFVAEAQARYRAALDALATAPAPAVPAADATNQQAA